MLRKTLLFLQRYGKIPDSLNQANNMCLGSIGLNLLPEPLRLRMPWTTPTEGTARRVLLHKDKSILEGNLSEENKNCSFGNALFANQSSEKKGNTTESLTTASTSISTDNYYNHHNPRIERSAIADPLDILKAAVSVYKYNTSTGKTLFQLCAEVPFDGRGQQVYRQEWQQGTYDKYVTISSVEYSRYANNLNGNCTIDEFDSSNSNLRSQTNISGAGGVLYGYITFHGESTLMPVIIKDANIPGWYMKYNPDKCVSYENIVQPPPSVGTEIEVNPKVYKLKSYPYYDSPNNPMYVRRLLRERGIVDDDKLINREEENDVPEEDEKDLKDDSIHVKGTHDD